MALERLQKVIAGATKISRREAEAFMLAGKVLVNGKPATQLGTKVDPTHDVVSIRGKIIRPRYKFEYVLFHKPRQCVVTRSDPEGRKTIYDHIPKRYNALKPVGRLDYDSEGLLMLTNDGELAQQLTHPRYHLEKVYEVKVQGMPSPRQIERLEKGVMLDGRKTKPAKVEVVLQNPKTTWLGITLTEGRNRQIRRMCEIVNLEIKTLVRQRMGPFELKSIPYGKCQEIRVDRSKLLNKNT